MTAKFKSDSRITLTPEYRPLELEQQVRSFWETNETASRLENYRLKKNIGKLGYVEGPPTLNGAPHVGHARGRTMKDLRFRWKTMQGYYIPFWAGWDCQGLPVELEVEKKLGVKNKRELLERIGEEKFIEECKKTVMKYHAIWKEVDAKLGVFINQNKAYYTYKDEYVEREWKYLKQAWDQGLLEEGHYVVAYCPGCQTSLSSAEVGYEGSYQQVEDPSLYFKFPVANTPNEFFLIWTTMPFTLITDLMIAVNPSAEYVKVRVKDEKWIMARRRVESVMQELGMENYELLETVPGSALEKTRYQYPFEDSVPCQAELERASSTVHTVVLEDFVDVETATGVVHLAPGNGEEDFFAGMRRRVPIFAPFDDEIKFTKEAGVFQGKYARDTDKIVVDELRKRGLLVQVRTIRHEYPTCWRSHHKLVWLARKEYFLRTDKIGPRVLEAAEKVDYFFDAPKNRFLSFLREGKPWCISRERVWGAPLPIWKCEKCGAKTIVSSKKELLEKAVNKPETDDFELHKPWIDRITFKCTKCEGTMRREDFVLDTWHNSGASPYARFSDEEFSEYIPADFLTEGIDQTRGWANTLLLEHAILTEKPQAPYKSFLFQGLAQDARGRKMSKSLGNVLGAAELLEKYSADVSRFYMMRKCSPIDFINFDLNELGRRTYQILSTLYHLTRFFMQNAQFDRFDPSEHTLQRAENDCQLKSVDRWVLSKLQKALENYASKLETSEYNLATAVLEDFVVDKVSRLYVPMVRKELWTDDLETSNRRLAIYATLWHTLKTTTLIFNPVTPYLSEALYQTVYRALDPSLPRSVNLDQWPTPNENLHNDTVEAHFDTLFRVVSLVNSARQAADVKRRWPLDQLIVVTHRDLEASLRGLEDLVLELTNTKRIEFSHKPIPAAEGWTSASEDNLQVFLDVRRNDALLGEGLMRDLARRVQALRKELGYLPTDMMQTVEIAELDDESIRLVGPYLDEMRHLVRTETVRLIKDRKEATAELHESQLDERKIAIAVKK